MTAVHRRSRAAAAPLALLALWLASCAAPASALAASPSRSRCVRSGDALGCTRLTASLSAAGPEAEEPEEELEESAEEAATAEAETEEEETGSPVGSRADHAGDPGSAVLSGLRLTARATTALAHHRPSASAIGFSFTLSAASKVRIALVEQVDSGGHELWAALPDSLTVAAGAGHVNRALTGHNRLSPGRYRLTVRPLAGRPRSIYLTVRR
jgi:hypothetical protein